MLIKNKKECDMNSEVDILVIGAGISGIGLSYYIKQLCPQKSLMILEQFLLLRHNLSMLTSEEVHLFEIRMP